jgi:hypothetical protein
MIRCMLTASALAAAFRGAAWPSCRRWTTPPRPRPPKPPPRPPGRARSTPTSCARRRTASPPSSRRQGAMPGGAGAPALRLRRRPASHRWPLPCGPPSPLQGGARRSPPVARGHWRPGLAPIPARSPTTRPSRSRWKPPARIRRPPTPPARPACAGVGDRRRRQEVRPSAAAPRPAFPAGLFICGSLRACPPRLTQARAPLTRERRGVNEHGEPQTISIPAERDLTVYVDKRELVTLMTLGAHPEWLVLGYLRNQRLVRVGRRDRVGDRRLGGRRAAVKTRTGIDRIEERTAQARGHHRLRPGQRVRRT